MTDPERLIVNLDGVNNLITGRISTSPQPVDCSDEPKLTAEEWAYIEAMGGEG